MKKRSICILTIILISLFALFNVQNIYAYDSIDSTNTAIWTKSSEEIKEQYGVTYSHMIGSAKINGVTNNERNVNFFSMIPDGDSSKLVTWAIQSGNSGFVTNTLSTIAKNYEKNHPGWIVVAGVNADQWYYETSEANPKGGYFYFKNQTYYPFSMDSQNLFTINPLGVTVNGAAITNDPNELLVDVGTSNSIELQVYDENDNLVGTFSVSGYNQTVGENETVVYSGYKSSTLGAYVAKTVTSERDIYIVDNAKLAYMNNTSEYPSKDIYGPVDSFYGRGVITSIGNNITLESGDFAIETSNLELQALLDVGVKVIVEQQFSNITEVESVSGYHTVQVKDGVYKSSNATYNTTGRARSFFGTTKDGKYFLMTTRNVSDVTGGTVHTENNAILSYYNADTCYQHDGGGSACAIYRNELGGFDVVSESTDSGKTERSVLTGLFFVVRDPGCNAQFKNSTSYSVLIEKNDIGTEYQNMSVIINNKTYEFNDDTLTINGLIEDTVYEAKVKYIYKGLNYEGYLYVKTDKYIPDLNFNVSSDSITISKQNASDILKIINANFELNGEYYSLNDEESLTIDSLFKNSTYEIVYSCTVLNTITGETQESNTYTKTFTTLKYDIPKIVKFEEYIKTDSAFKISYIIEDPDSTITNMYIKCNDLTYILTQKSGIYTYTSDTLEYKDHSFILVVEYKTLDYYSGTVESVEITHVSNHTHTLVDANCQNPQYCLECGETFGDIGEHSFSEATKKVPATCIHCGLTQGEKKKGCVNCNIYVIIASFISATSAIVIFKKRK